MTSLLQTSVALLPAWKYQDPAWCANYAGPQTFLAVFETEAGRWGLCLGCGDEKFLPFSRMTGVAA